MKWSISPFEQLYNSIQDDVFDFDTYREVLSDLKILNLTSNIQKNTTSRAELEKGAFKTSTGDSYKANQEFIISAITLSDELNLDELVTAELMLQFSSDPSDAELDTSLVNSGKVTYYLRRQYILQIVSYIVNCHQKTSKIYTELVADGKLAANILSAFLGVQTQLDEIKQLINKAQILDTYDILFQQNVKFRRGFLLKEYDTLGQILFGLVKNDTLMRKDELLNLINHVSQLDSNDFFIVYYLPALFHAFSRLSSLPDADVKHLHSEFIKELNSETIYTKPVKVTLIFVFLTYFIGWCKASPATRAKHFDFATTVDEPISIAVELGAVEQLMVFAADTSAVEKDRSMELFYDMRSLLERHIPRLIPKQLMDVEHTASTTGNAWKGNSGNQFSNITLSDQSLSFFLSSFHDFVQTFITDCAFLLTKTKDAEEDSLLSGEDLLLDDISAKADLERFFLVIYYFYASRPEYSQFFWQDKESNAYGFIEWASKCNDSLMKSSFYLMISSLSFGTENSLNVYHYINGNQNISWNSIAQIISEYIAKISNLEKKIQEHLQRNQDEVNDAAIGLEDGLNEEVIVLLSSLFTLIGSVAFDADEETKSSLSSLFTDILFEFLKVNTPLTGAAMKVLSNLVPQDEDSRFKFWISLDAWIFKCFPLSVTDDSYRSAFQNVLATFSDISGFLNLISRLLKVSSKNANGYMTFGKFAFPLKLGQGYRKVGIWPYFDFIFKEAFVRSRMLENLQGRKDIELLVLDIIESSLYSFDYSVILNSIPAGANLDNLVITEDFFAYVHESPATAVMNYLFNERVFKVLFEIASIGVDKLSTELENDVQELSLVQSAVKIINQLLTYQETYVEELCPIIKRHQKHGYFIPTSFGLHGLRSFYDAILFNLPIIAHFGLYVGLENYELASQSLGILKKLSLKFSNDDIQSINKNKLLTVFDSVDESARIKQAFINQLETPVTGERSLSLKLEILDFVSSNLSLTDKTPTVSHFFLGFQVTNILSLGPKLSTFICSEVSLLKSLSYLITSSLSVVNHQNVDYAPMRLASSSMEIILKLCRNPMTSSMVLEYLTSQSLFENILELDPKIDMNTLWCGKPFEGDFNEDSASFTQSPSIGALLSFLSYRSLVLQYLSLDIHRLSTGPQKSKMLPYVESLISSKVHSPTIFSFLDTLGYNATPLTNEALKGLVIFGGMDLNLDKITRTNSCAGNIYDFTALNSLMSLKVETQAVTSRTENSLSSISHTNSLAESADAESKTIKSYITSYLVYEKFSSLQLSVLHSWVQLVQIIVIDGGLTPVARSNFILEVFEAVIPKINDYVEFDVAYSEELVSLSVFLYDLYQKDRNIIDGNTTVDGRLHSLFQTCVHGITSPLSTLSLRSDFYVLANRYLLRILKEEAFVKELLQSLKMTNERLVEVICNDAISGEGSSRVTGILLLDSLTQIAGLNKVNFVLEALVKRNMLLLIIRSIKTTDELLSLTSEDITLDNLLYELTAFKSTVYFLIRIAETRSGAQALIQNEIFQTIESCSFLKIDPDLGLELVFDEVTVRNSQFVRVNLSLDNPLSLGKVNGISLFEVLVPIFQLISSILLSMGSANKTVIKKVRHLLVHFRKLVQGVIKRDALIETDEKYQIKGPTLEGLQQLVKLVVLLSTLTGYHGEETLH